MYNLMFSFREHFFVNRMAQLLHHLVVCHPTGAYVFSILIFGVFIFI